MAHLRAGAVRDVEVTFETPVPPHAFADLPGADRLRLDTTCTTLSGQVIDSPDALIKALAGYPVTGLRATEPALEDSVTAQGARPWRRGVARVARLPLRAEWVWRPERL